MRSALRSCRGDERDGIAITCTITVMNAASQMGGYATSCNRRPVFRCTSCGALVCEKHAGKLCPAVDGNGRPCIRRLTPGQWQRHEHEYQT